MSGFTNVAGFAPPTSIAGFMGLLQTASFRGVPFKVIAAQTKKGRRQAIHEYAVAPEASMQAFTIAGLSGISSMQQAQVSAALTTLFLQKDSPLATTSIEQSDCAAAITAIGGLPSFAITSPSSWPITSAAGFLFTLGTVTYS